MVAIYFSGSNNNLNLGERTRVYEVNAIKYIRDPEEHIQFGTNTNNLTCLPFNNTSMLLYETYLGLPLINEIGICTMSLTLTIDPNCIMIRRTIFSAETPQLINDVYYLKEILHCMSCKPGFKPVAWVQGIFIIQL
jgi:hypothetical protein